LEKASADFNNNFERYCWNELEKKLKTSDTNKKVKDLLDPSITDKEVLNEILALGNALTQHVDKKDAIDGISETDIIIHVKPAVLTRLAQAGLIGNNAQQMFVGGQYAIGYVGGFQIIGNRFLKEIDAIASATFFAGSMVNVNAANYDRLAPTNDYGLYYEAMGLFGIVYPTCVRTIFNK
ncbi:hypothetical protein, partial [Metamycoplasma hyosynoviae]